MNRLKTIWRERHDHIETYLLMIAYVIAQALVINHYCFT